MSSQPPLDRLVPDYIKRFEAYIPSKPDDVLKKLYGCSKLYRLNNNENPLGPPPAACKAIRRFPPVNASIYPSGDAYHLRCKLGETFGMHPDQFLVGNGANEVIAFVIKAFCQQGDNIITAEKTFAVYEWVAEFSGFEARLAPLKDFGFDAEGMLERIDERTKILLSATPQPTEAGGVRKRSVLSYRVEVARCCGGRGVRECNRRPRRFTEPWRSFPIPNLVIFRNLFEECMPWLGSNRIPDGEP